MTTIEKELQKAFLELHKREIEVVMTGIAVASSFMAPETFGRPKKGDELLMAEALYLIGERLTVEVQPPAAKDKT